MDPNPSVPKLLISGTQSILALPLYRDEATAHLRRCQMSAQAAAPSPTATGISISEGPAVCLLLSRSPTCSYKESRK